MLPITDLELYLTAGREELQRLRRVEQAAREYHDYRYSTAVSLLDYSKLSRLYGALKAALEDTGTVTNEG